MVAAHWEIIDRLRQVSLHDKATTGRRLPTGHTVIGYGFFTHREMPRTASHRAAPGCGAPDGQRP
jgi:hypothetical protein